MPARHQPPARASSPGARPMASMGEGARIEVGDGGVVLKESGLRKVIELEKLEPAGAEGDVLTGEGHFDPPTTPLDKEGQGVPYATYGFAAQMAEVEVDCELGSSKV